jgi:hypothetical protein
MEILVRHHHVPTNPEFLIGRHMGVEQVDILSELNSRSMTNVTDQIMRYMSVNDHVRMAGVSTQWRNIVKQNNRVNRDRVKFIKSKKAAYVHRKENRPSEEGFEFTSLRQEFAASTRRPDLANSFSNRMESIEEQRQQKLAKKGLNQNLTKFYQVKSDLNIFFLIMIFNRLFHSN